MEQKQFMLYGYSCPTDGSYFVDEQKFWTGTDYRTAERYAEYRDCGFNVLLHEGNDPYWGEPFETSNLKMVMDRAQSVGLKVLVYDRRIHDLSTHETLVGGEGLFADETELEKYVLDCMKDYTKHPTFLGVQFIDEPNYRLFPTIGILYRLIKKHYPDAFVKVNLFPAVKWVKASFSPDENLTVPQRYEQYMRSFLRETGADYLMFDSYPMARTNDYTYWIRPDHFDSLQVAVKLCKEKKISLYVVAQTCSHSFQHYMCTRKVSRADMYWQIHLLAGLGVRRIMYFTYWRKQMNRVEGEWFYNDGSSIMTQTGERNPLYYWLKEIHTQLQRFAPILLEYRFSGLCFVRGAANRADYANLYETYELDSVRAAECSREGIFVLTELEKTGSKLIMIENICDPEVHGGPEQIRVMFKGNIRQTFRIDGGKAIPAGGDSIELELRAGEAVFLDVEEAK